MAKKKPQKTTKQAPFFNTFAGQMVMIFIAIACIVFLPTSLLLMIGMLPTITAMLFSVKGNIARAYCVAATNFVGCFIFVLELWSVGHTFERSIEIITNPISMMIIYSAAGFGYFFDWFITGMMASVIQQRAKGRLSIITERQKKLVENWGQKVTGTIPLDEDGFPIERS